MADNSMINATTINNIITSLSELQRLSLKQLFISSSDNSSTNSLPIIGDLTSSGLVVWTMKMPFSLSTTSKNYLVSFTNGPVFNESPTLSFAVQMDNANFGVIPIITNLSTTGAGITLKVVAGSPDATHLVTGNLHIQAIGYH